MQIPTYPVGISYYPRIQSYNNNNNNDNKTLFQATAHIGTNTAL